MPDNYATCVWHNQKPWQSITSFPPFIRDWKRKKRNEGIYIVTYTLTTFTCLTLKPTTATYVALNASLQTNSPSLIVVRPRKIL